MIPQPNEIYKHFKGNLYKIITIAKDSETGEKMVVYQALYGDYDTYVRSLEMFTSPVDKVKYPEALQAMRFERVDALNTPNVAAAPAAMTNGSNSLDCGGQDNNDSASEKMDESDSDMAWDDAPLSPLVEKFLDTDSIDEKLLILSELEPTVTNRDINIITITMDMEIDEKLELKERFEQLKERLILMSRFQSNRLRG